MTRARAPHRAPVLAPAPRRVVAEVHLRLPLPPSVNRLWSPRRGKGVRRSDVYTRWLADAGWMLQAQRPGRVEGAYTLHLGVPRACRADADNLAKGPGDLLQAHGVVENDRLAERVEITRQDAEPLLLVTVRPHVDLFAGATA